MLSVQSTFESEEESSITKDLDEPRNDFEEKSATNYQSLFSNLRIKL